jgi:mutator protein MutT
MKQKPFAVSALIINKKGKILCVSRKDDYNDYGMIGGKIDPGETPQQAIIREIKEETNLKVKEKDLVEIFNGKCYTKENESKINICYLVKIYEGKPKQMEKGLVKWDSFYKVIEGSFGDYNKQVLDKVLFNYIDLIIGMEHAKNV